jgi:flagellar motor protein MotB
MIALMTATLIATSALTGSAMAGGNGLSLQASAETPKPASTAGRQQNRRVEISLRK